MVGVSVRIRPGAQHPVVSIVGDRVHVNTRDVQRDFAFDHVYGCDATQEDVSQFSNDLVARCLRGQVASLLCYGQTGSGKTHTMGMLTEVQTGIVPHCVREILSRTGSRRVRLEFIELYLNQVRDLLNVHAKLNLRDMGNYGVVVENVTHVEVKSCEEAMEIVSLASKYRQAMEVSLDRGLGLRHLSSRTHAILTIHVEMCATTQHWGRLVLVDLAGSERSINSIAPRLVEARHINASLASLGNVVHALATHKKHRPWRDSKLTKLLWNGLYRGHVRILATIHADAEFAMETLSTLAFASRCKRLTVPASPVQSPRAVVSNDDQRQENRSSRWFAQVLSAISGECDSYSSDKDLPDAPPECTHMLPMTQECVGKIKWLKNIMQLHMAMADPDFAQHASLAPE